MLITVELALVVVVTGLAVGLLLALIANRRTEPLNAMIVVFVDVLRAMPPLVIVLIFYFGLPNVGLTLSSFAVLWLVLSAVLAAFAEEIFWAGILSVRRGQWDAARSTGLTFLDTLAFVVLPQTFRMVLPPLVNRTIAITKNTAFGTVIGVPELLNQATTAVSFLSNAYAADARRHRLSRHFRARRAVGQLAGTALCVPEGVMDALIEQFFNLNVMMKAFPLLMRGLGMTLLLCLAVIPLGFFGGLLVALARLSRFATLRICVRILTDVFRALPPLVLLILIYSGLPFAGVRLNPFTSVCIAFFLNTSAYYGEVLRAGIEQHRLRAMGGGALDRPERG